MQKNVIPFMNMKGGVGKTTICVNIAGYLASIGKKVLIIDNDPQMNASQYLLDAKTIEGLMSGTRTIYGLYKDTTDEDFIGMSGESLNNSSIINETDIIMEIRENLHMVCGDLNMTKVNGLDGSTIDILSMFIENNDLRDKYDFIFIDCPPTQSIYTNSAFKASDFYILVIKPDFLSTVGVSLFKKIIERYNKRRQKEAKLHELGIIVNLIQTNNQYHKDKIDELKERFKFNKIFASSIPNKSSIAKASESHQLMHETIGCKQGIQRLSKEFLKEYENKINEGMN